jgi:hypothetical protein
MSFRLFIYYCAVCGGWAAIVGWSLGRMIAGGEVILAAGVKGMFLGLLVAFALGLVDGLWNQSRRFVTVGMRVLVAAAGGGLAGLVGGVIGQTFYSKYDLPVFLIMGWAITGLLIGVSLGAFDFLARVLRGEDRRGALRKILNGLIGGAVGGILGGILFLLVKSAWGGIFRDRQLDELWSPSAAGFVALGLCIGLAIGLAQVILKDSWLRIEKGFRKGREMILSKPEITLGRGEWCDVGLFGDPAVEKTHARIRRSGNNYVLADEETAGGTFLNGQRIRQPALLRSGDAIQIGSSVLRFRERQKR